MERTHGIAPPGVSEAIGTFMVIEPKALAIAEKRLLPL
jgi:hypothetical protein